MERILILTIRAKGGGAEKIIENLTNSKPSKFEWMHMEKFLDTPFLYRYVKFIWLIYRAIKCFDKIIIGTEGILGLIVFPFKVFFYKKKFILWNHCYFEDYQFFLSKKNRILYQVSYAMYPLKINASPATKKGVFVPNPYFFNKIHAANHFTNKKEFTLLSVSSLAKLKRVDLTIKLLAELPEEFSLNIFGDGVERNNLEHLVDEIGVRDRVQFLGFAKNPFYLYTCRARILIINSQTEALPTIILEAIEHSVPVIVRAYIGAEYWQKLKTVFILEDITSNLTLDIVSYFNKLSENEYVALFGHDLHILKKKHDYSYFMSQLDAF
ncbi:hypothetical protein C2855_05605 [Aeromonas bestiarum]|uniref:Glycosyl transferase, group 1 family protein n=1 Tax=Aeromonas bestiarum TaxID=105751 RepID=A0A068FT03_9GAMM|nr:glycosyltransferase [Aeromonas bestiarum]AID70969.1 glycosyl transferase, group 1 family protein [Aeromonas bestiarum]POG24546.1 hypothetical protein C2855_05605 [Aeromonas bestiarum]